MKCWLRVVAWGGKRGGLYLIVLKVRGVSVEMSIGRSQGCVFGADAGGEGVSGWAALESQGHTFV